MAKKQLGLPIIFTFLQNDLSIVMTSAERDGEEGGGDFFNSSLPFHPLHKHLDISREITVKSSALHIGSTGLKLGTFGLRAQVANH